MEFIFIMLDGELVRDWTQQQQEDAVRRMAAFKRPLVASGRWKDGGGMGGDQEAARVRVTDGKATVLDGPFLDAKQIAGGYMVVDCASREDAIELATACPAAQ